MKSIGVYVVVVLVACMFTANDAMKPENTYCYTTDPNPYLNFGTKASYEHHHSKKIIKYPPGCKPVYFWLVSRHGTRWAEAGDIDQFKELFEMREKIKENWNEGRGELCNKDFFNLKTWKFDMIHEFGYKLTQQGQDDLYFLGGRFRHYFPELLESPYNPKQFIVRHTDKERTKQSAEFFFKGVFNLNYYGPPPEIRGAMSTEHLIFPYKNCPKFDTLGPEVKKERVKFEKGELVAKVINRVSRRLGFTYNLTYANIKAMFDGCRYHKAWYVHQVSPWCAAFVYEDLKVLEYNEDIRYYYKSGAGTPINLRLGCPIVKDLIDRFTDYEDDPTSQPKAVFYMSHVNMINMLTARLGLIDQPEHLKATDYEKQKNRAYRTSEIVPFTGNVAAVLYRCADGLNVVFYMSERKVLYKGCDDGLCKLSFLRDRFNFTRDEACMDTSFCFEDVPAKPGSGAPVASGASTVPVLLLLYPIATSILLYLKQ